MKINQNTSLVGSLVSLVPYKKLHVPKYNQFMLCEELQRLTASEPLTLQNEYEMQESWAEDEDKCTFIILDAAKYKESQDEVSSMIGDTNLYIIEKNLKEKTAEAAVMIADSCYRSKGFGWEAMLLMLNYGVQTLGIKKYVVKISTSNLISIRFFTKMKFKEESKSEVFQEITMVRPVDSDWKLWLLSELKGYQTVSI